MKTIHIRGARTHNLKNFDLSIPRDQFIVITGVSGSGKSSLAFDTLYAEGQRRYVESLSAYARQFLSMMEKPDVDHIEGLSPAISIEQKSTSHNPRSTVGTVTEIYDYCRLLFARVGEPHCPTHHTVLAAQTVSQMVDSVLALPKDTKLMILAPVVVGRKGEHIQVIESLRRQGFVRARIDGTVYELENVPALDLRRKHTIEAVIDRVKVNSELALRLADSFETALRITEGITTVAFIDNDKAKDIVFSSRFACTECGYSIAELEPRLFSFNNPAGACPACDGLGVKQSFDPHKIIRDPERSLTEGAIRGWDSRNQYCFQLLQALAKHFHIDLDKPFKKLTKSIQDMILYGSGDEEITFRYRTERGATFTKKHPFEGVIPNMDRRYHDTESQSVREDLSGLLMTRPCPDCNSTRLRIEARNVFVSDLSLPQITALPIKQTLNFFDKLKLPGKRGEIASKIQKEIRERLLFLVNVGLEYLTLNRSADTLSGGEAQRIRLASQIGAGLVGVMYILDEPSIGLHQRDNARLLESLHKLRDLGNTVIVVEHDYDAINSADHIIDMGPGAGIHGGQVIAEGTPEIIKKHPDSLTGHYLSGKRKIVLPTVRKAFNAERVITLRGASANNLQKVDVTIPASLLICITGVSGSGKSSLINDTLYPIAARELNGATQLEPGPYESIKGLELYDSVIDIDQSPIGRTPRSNAATYTGMFTPIRELFSATPEARSRGYQPGRFSFNVKGGRCESCEGDGVIKVEMHFLADIYVMCDVCKGKRYNRETLEIKYKGKNIYEVLSMTVEDALSFFSAIPVVSRKLQTLVDVGLAYICLGQSATTLSGGEAQRVKLSRELSKRSSGNSLYILDEPTTGLHFYDIEQLLKVLHRLRDQGNTIIVIEHNLDVIKTADWIIDLGPEGGDQGGRIVVTGTPEQVAKNANSHTGRYLKGVLKK
jgi:excinuclease ABC subunit A